MFPAETECKSSRRGRGTAEVRQGPPPHPQITVRTRARPQSLKLTLFLQSGDPQRMDPEKRGAKRRTFRILRSPGRK